jgi:hypothetical protein
MHPRVSSPISALVANGDRRPNVHRAVSEFPPMVTLNSGPSDNMSGSTVRPLLLRNSPFGAKYDLSTRRCAAAASRPTANCVDASTGRTGTSPGTSR